MLYSEIIALCSEIHTKHINTLCGQNVELLSVTRGGTYSDHWALQGYKRTNAICTLYRRCSKGETLAPPTLQVSVNTQCLAQRS
jgi:hypothetical protein